jgi:hypothetical protein
MLVLSKAMMRTSLRTLWTRRALSDLVLQVVQIGAADGSPIVCSVPELPSSEEMSNLFYCCLRDLRNVKVDKYTPAKHKRFRDPIFARSAK